MKAIRQAYNSKYLVIIDSVSQIFNYTIHNNNALYYYLVNTKLRYCYSNVYTLTFSTPPSLSRSPSSAAVCHACYKQLRTVKIAKIYAVLLTPDTTIARQSVGFLTSLVYRVLDSAWDWRGGGPMFDYNYIIEVFLFYLLETSAYSTWRVETLTWPCVHYKNIRNVRAF